MAWENAGEGDNAGDDASSGATSMSISPFTGCCPVADAQLLLVGRGDGSIALYLMTASDNASEPIKTWSPPHKQENVD